MSISVLKKKSHIYPSHISAATSNFQIFDILHPHRPLDRWWILFYFFTLKLHPKREKKYCCKKTQQNPKRMPTLNIKIHKSRKKSIFIFS